MSRFARIDLSRLPPPQIIETPAFETMFDKMKATVEADFPELSAALATETEPTVWGLRAVAYWRMLDALEFNDRARGNLLALASGADLDHLGAAWGLERLTVQEGDPDAVPPIPEIEEADDALRRRIQLAPEALTSAGTEGSYLFHALSADGRIKDASVIGGLGDGSVIVTVLQHVAEGGSADGTPSQDVLDAVEAIVTRSDVRALNDTVTVQPPTIVEFEIEASLTLYPGPGAGPVQAEAEARLDAYLDRVFALDHDVTRAGIVAALYAEGVQNVELTLPAADLVIGKGEVARCTDKTLAVEGYDV